MMFIRGIVKGNITVRVSNSIMEVVVVVVEIPDTTIGWADLRDRKEEQLKREALNTPKSTICGNMENQITLEPACKN